MHLAQQPSCLPLPTIPHAPQLSWQTCGKLLPVRLMGPCHRLERARCIPPYRQHLRLAQTRRAFTPFRTATKHISSTLRPICLRHHRLQVASRSDLVIPYLCQPQPPQVSGKEVTSDIPVYYILGNNNTGCVYHPPSSQL